MCALTWNQLTFKEDVVDLSAHMGSVLNGVENLIGDTSLDLSSGFTGFEVRVSQRSRCWS